VLRKGGGNSSNWDYSQSKKGKEFTCLGACFALRIEKKKKKFVDQARQGGKLEERGGEGGKKSRSSSEFVWKKEQGRRGPPPQAGVRREGGNVIILVCGGEGEPQGEGRVKNVMEGRVSVRPSGRGRDGRWAFVSRACMEKKKKKRDNPLPIFHMTRKSGLVSSKRGAVVKF